MGKGNPHGEYSWDSWEISMGILTGHGESPRGQFPVGTLETRPGGRAEFSLGRFLLDLGIFAWVEQALDTAENCSTPYSRHRIRPGRFCLGRIPGLRPGVEQVLARMGCWLDPRRNAWVEIPPDPGILPGGGHNLHHMAWLAQDGLRP